MTDSAAGERTVLSLELARFVASLSYDDLPPEIRRQRDDLLAAVEEHGEEAFLREE